MYRSTIPILTLSAVVGLGACRDSAPSASDWAAKVNSVCAQLNTTRKETAAKHLPGDTEPTRDQLMAFAADFAPEFRAYGQRLEDLDRPDNLDDQIDKLFDAYNDVVTETEQAATDPAAAQTQLDVGGNTEPVQRLVTQSTELGLTTCVG